MEQDRDYICSKPEDNGMHQCNDLPHFKVGDMVCNDSAIVGSTNSPTEKSCVNWNQYYTECKASPYNPFQGTISFDNIGLAWVAIFLVSTIVTLYYIHFYTEFPFLIFFVGS
jgi:voltage-dependent calcium channel T type alpha-1G